MSYVLISLALVVVGVVAYDRFVERQMRRTIATCYNSVVARFLPTDAVISLWRTIYLKDVRQHLTGQQLEHELYHINVQWQRWPRSFLFRYLLESALHGYDKNKYEQAARKAAGQATR